MDKDVHMRNLKYEFSVHVVMSGLNELNHKIELTTSTRPWL